MPSELIPVTDAAKMNKTKKILCSFIHTPPHTLPFFLQANNQFVLYGSLLKPMMSGMQTFGETLMPDQPDDESGKPTIYTVHMVA